ncbi:hypothetical protein [Rhizorhabdus argentea]|uniref:hypothetical protein n=1 Tax=Rhizorhabdus argentea TaxID=1387174 RepID=UPI0030ECF3B8
MRENSGKGAAENNLRDPTLDEHAAQGGQRAPRPKPGGEAEVGGNARAAGEDPSPDNRARGETSRADHAPPADPYPKR